jgi:AcrR family transcriptional regulator
MRSPIDEGRRRIGRPPGPPLDPTARREELLDAAERVIRARGPDIGMSDIAAEIGLTKPAVYRSLGDKAQLSAALGRRVAERLAGQLVTALGAAGELRSVVGAAIDVFCRFVDEDTNLYRFVIHGSIGTRPTGLQDKPLVTRLGRQISTSLAVALDRAEAQPRPAATSAGPGPPAPQPVQPSADTWAYAILGAVFAATEHWLRHRHLSRAQLVEQLVQLLAPALEQARLAPEGSESPSSTG